MKDVGGWFCSKGAGLEGGAGRLNQSVRGNCKSFKGIHLTVLNGMHQFYHEYPASRTTSEERAECLRGCVGGWGYIC